MSPLERVLNRLNKVSESETGWKACCPVHDDRHPSLSVTTGQDDRVLLKCHAGCSVEEICMALDMTVAELHVVPNVSTSTNSPETAGKCQIRRRRQSSGTRQHFNNVKEAVAELERRHGAPTKVWPYTDQQGNTVGLILRWDHESQKTIRPISRKEAVWRIKGMPVPRPLYRLTELANAERVFVCEGEKAADAACSIGLVATTSAHGSGAADKTDWSPLAGKDVIVLPDNDSAGHRYAEKVAELLSALEPPSKVKLLELDDLPESGDMHDWLEQRDAHDSQELKETINRLADQASGYQPGPTRPHVQSYQPFPVNCLPDVVNRFIRECATAIVCDPSYVALPILASLAAAIGNSRRLQLKPGWNVPPIIWTVVVGESGTAKTPASRPVRRLIQDKQGRALQQHTEAMEQYSRELLCWEKEYSKWKRSKSAEGDPPVKPEQPQAERFVVSDTTVEALAPLLLHNPRGLLVACDELAGWIGSFDRYAGGQGADAAHWLSMHSGESIIVDRKTGNPRMLYVPRAAVCITGSIQPGVLHRALGTEHRESGMAARLLVSCPPRQPKQWSEAGIDPFLEYEMGILIDRLYDLQPEIDDEGESQPQVIHMTEGARTEWIEFYNTHNRLQVEMTGEMAAAWSKLEEYAARFALVIHCVRTAMSNHTPESPEEVDAESIASGVTLARWFGQEAQRVYNLLSETAEQRNRRELVDLIRQKGGRITPRELVQSSRRYRPTSAAEAALEDLRTEKYGRWSTVETATKSRHEFVLTEDLSTNSP